MVISGIEPMLNGAPKLSVNYKRILLSCDFVELFHSKINIMPSEDGLYFDANKLWFESKANPKIICNKI